MAIANDAPINRMVVKEREIIRKNDSLMLPGFFPQSLDERKQILLRNLASPSGKVKYKRYVGLQ